MNSKMLKAIEPRKKGMFRKESELTFEFMMLVVEIMNEYKIGYVNGPLSALHPLRSSMMVLELIAFCSVSAFNSVTFNDFRDWMLITCALIGIPHRDIHWISRRAIRCRVERFAIDMTVYGDGVSIFGGYARDAFAARSIRLYGEWHDIDIRYSDQDDLETILRRWKKLVGIDRHLRFTAVTTCLYGGKVIYQLHASYLGIKMASMDVVIAGVRADDFTCNTVEYRNGAFRSFLPISLVSEHIDNKELWFLDEGNRLCPISFCTYCNFRGSMLALTSDDGSFECIPGIEFARSDPNICLECLKGMSELRIDMCTHGNMTKRVFKLARKGWVVKGTLNRIYRMDKKEFFCQTRTCLDADHE